MKISEGSSKVTLVYNSKITTDNVPTIATDSGYRFLGWLSGENNALYDSEGAADYVVTGNVTFTAQYVKIPELTAAFD